MQFECFSSVSDKRLHCDWNFVSSPPPPGYDELAILPKLETLLTSQQLMDVGLTKDPTFQFLMKAGYEQLERIQSSISDWFNSVPVQFPNTTNYVESHSYISILLLSHPSMPLFARKDGSCIPVGKVVLPWSSAALQAYSKATSKCSEAERVLQTVRLRPSSARWVTSN